MKETLKEKDLMLLSFHELISIGQRIISSSLMLVKINPFYSLAADNGDTVCVIMHPGLSRLTNSLGH